MERCKYHHSCKGWYVGDRLRLEAVGKEHDSAIDRLCDWSNFHSFLDLEMPEFPLPQCSPSSGSSWKECQRRVPAEGCLQALLAELGSTLIVSTLR